MSLQPSTTCAAWYAPFGNATAGERILTGHTGDRLIVDLVSYQSAGSTLVTTIGRSPLVQRAEPGLNTGGYLVQDGKSFGVSLSMVDLGSCLSAPPSIAALHLRPGGIIISEKAAADLHVRVGDHVTLRHPQRVGTGFRFVDSRLPVTATLLRWSQIGHNAGSRRGWSCVRTERDGRLRAAQIAHLISRGRPEGCAPTQCNSALRDGSISWVHRSHDPREVPSASATG
jgi:hypothetical protein